MRMRVRRRRYFIDKMLTNCRDRKLCSRWYCGSGGCIAGDRQGTSRERKRVAIIGAGIVGVSTAIWLQRDGHEVDPDRPRRAPAREPATAMAACWPPARSSRSRCRGCSRKAPRMLLDPNQPLFLKWRYLPKLAPWLIRYLAQCQPSAVARTRGRALHGIIGDSLADHQALAAGHRRREMDRAVRLSVPLQRPRRITRPTPSAGRSARAHGFDWDVLEGPGASRL